MYLTYMPARKKPKAKTAFAKKLQAARARRNLSQIEAAAKIGVSARTLISWENDQAAPGRFTEPLLKAAFPEVYE